MLFIDAHVHIYDCFNLETFFDSAFDNFQVAARRQGKENAFTAILLLAETEQEKSFDRFWSWASLKKGIENKTAGGWVLQCTEENCSLHARSDKDKELLIIAGRQISTIENIEVLALATSDKFEDRASLMDTLKAVEYSGSIPVIPWGVFKWWGRRGKIIGSLLETIKKPVFFLGDNGGRPIFWPRPNLFKLGDKKGIRVLPGSDPLPITSESKRVGSFGLSIRGSISKTRPAEQLKKMLTHPETHFYPYGQLRSPIKFFQNQLNLKIRTTYSSNKS